MANWTDGEKEIFEKKIAFYGKNFAAIAAFLQKKARNLSYKKIDLLFILLLNLGVSTIEFFN